MRSSSPLSRANASRELQPRQVPHELDSIDARHLEIKQNHVVRGDVRFQARECVLWTRERVDALVAEGRELVAHERQREVVVIYKKDAQRHGWKYA